MTTKPLVICTGCKIPQPPENFYTNRRGPQGLSWRCRSCLRQQAIVHVERTRAAAQANPVPCTRSGCTRIITLRPKVGLCETCYSIRKAKADPNNSAKHAVRNARYRQKHPNVLKRAKLMARYNMSFAKRQHLEAAQGNRCAICLKPPAKKALSVDHDHSTGDVRGLLCAACNFALGALQESHFVLARALAYLELFRPSTEPFEWRHTRFVDLERKAHDVRTLTTS